MYQPNHRQIDSCSLFNHIEYTGQQRAQLTAMAIAVIATKINTNTIKQARTQTTIVRSVFPSSVSTKSQADQSSPSHKQSPAEKEKQNATQDPTKTARGKLADLTTETVQSATLALEGIDDVERSNGLALGVLGVGDGVTDDTLEEGLEDTTGLFVDHCEEKRR